MAPLPGHGVGDPDRLGRRPGRCSTGTTRRRGRRRPARAAAAAVTGIAGDRVTGRTMSRSAAGARVPGVGSEHVPVLPADGHGRAVSRSSSASETAGGDLRAEGRGQLLAEQRPMLGQDRSSPWTRGLAWATVSTGPMASKSRRRWRQVAWIRASTRPEGREGRRSRAGSGWRAGTAACAEEVSDVVEVVEDRPDGDAGLGGDCRLVGVGCPRLRSGRSSHRRCGSRVRMPRASPSVRPTRLPRVGCLRRRARRALAGPPAMAPLPSAPAGFIPGQRSGFGRAGSWHIASAVAGRPGEFSQ